MKKRQESWDWGWFWPSATEPQALDHVIIVPPDFDNRRRVGDQLVRAMTSPLQCLSPYRTTLLNDVLAGDKSFSARISLAPERDDKRRSPVQAEAELFLDAAPTLDGKPKLCGNARFYFDNIIQASSTFLALDLKTPSSSLEKRVVQASALVPLSSNTCLFGVLPLLEIMNSSRDVLCRPDVPTTSAADSRAIRGASEALTVGLRYDTDVHQVGASLSFKPTQPSMPRVLSWGTMAYKNLFVGAEFGADVAVAGLTAGGTHDHAGDRTSSSSILSPNLDLAILYRESHTDAERFVPKYEVGMEMKDNGSKMLFSYYQNMVIRRKVQNPMEDENVVGIHNYINMGLEFAVNSASSASSSSSSSAVEAAADTITAGASWQVNKNVMLKGRVSSSKLSTALCLRSWGDPVSSLSLAAHNDLQTGKLSLGLHCSLDNLGDTLYGSTSRGYKGATHSLRVKIPNAKMASPY